MAERKVNAPVIVYPPARSGGRRVTVRGRIVGMARGRGDVSAYLSRAGLAPDDAALDDPTLIEWRGGGVDDWPDPAA